LNAPVSGIYLTAGQHSIRVELPGYKSVTRTVQVRPPEPVALDFNLSSQNIRFNVASRPAGAVFLNGQATGKQTGEWLEAPVGSSVTVEVRAPGYSPASQVVQLTGDHDHRVIDLGLLQPAGLSEDAQGRLERLRLIASNLIRSVPGEQRRKLSEQYLRESDGFINGGVDL